MADFLEDTTLPVEEREFRKTITLIGDNTRDRGNPLLWPFQCLSWDHRRGQANNSSNGRQRDHTGSKEEGIPLKTISLSAGPQMDGGDS
ncbi:uncharacterized protein isoform X3 [Notothenia coriiceps]|uniref:Uncharacterized protein isoform X3 n=1 Tax=Notothenia coriiceps TaxID=8208 RepID=A0A6I9MSC3_9TELE|nr:PREDICTED: uncharacterized protein LOC104941299 isoform X3 [Notothenia coriiceps]